MVGSTTWLHDYLVKDRPMKGEEKNIFLFPHFSILIIFSFCFHIFADSATKNGGKYPRKSFTRILFYTVTYIRGKKRRPSLYVSVFLLFHVRISRKKGPGGGGRLCKELGIYDFSLKIVKKFV